MSDIDAQLQQFLDQPCGPYNSWDEVNQAMIRHWCEAMGDGNPVYTDPDFAARSVHGGIVAPPTMMQAWTMRGITTRWATGSDTREPLAVLQFLNDLGYPAVVAVNCEQTYHRYLRLGDRIHHTSRIESISQQKTTALGVGFFVTELVEFRDAAGDKIGDMRFRLFKYKAHERPAAPASAAPGKPAKIGRFRPVESHDTKFFWEGARAGKLLIQRCTDCGTLRHPPGPMCPACQSLAWQAVESSGRGVVYSFVVMHHPPIPPFDYPNIVLLVELEEGTRLVSQLVDARPDEVTIGAPVEVVFREVEDGLTLPQFRLRTKGG